MDKNFSQRLKFLFYFKFQISLKISVKVGINIIKGYSKYELQENVRIWQI